MVKITRCILTVIIIFCLQGKFVFAQAPKMPHGFAPWEVFNGNIFSGFRIASAYTNPPASPVRASAEWEEIDALMVVWTEYISTVRQIVKYAREECKVYIVCNDSVSVKEDLVSNSISLDNIFYLQEDYNSIWCRDYGQWNVYQNNADSLFLIDWIYNRNRPEDDAVPGFIAEYADIPLYQTIESPYKLINTGGNFMTDGWGTGFSSKLILEAYQGGGLTITPQNEDTINMIMEEFMGINRYIKMESLPYDEIHHIDMHLKLLDEETLLVGEYPAGVADGPQIEENINYILENYNSVFGTPYKIVRIPMPPDASNDYPDDGGAYRTYTNCVFVNKTVLVPIYEEEFDTVGLRILRENLPGYNVVGINCNSIINSLGAIHCITKEVGVTDPLVITHQPLHDTENTTDDYSVNAWVHYNSVIGINYSDIYFTTDTLTAWNFSNMVLTDSATNTWTGYIPAQPEGTTIYYYIDAMSNDGKKQVRPITAPQGFWQFRIGEQITAVNNFVIEEPVIIYPNPATNEIHVEFKEDSPIASHISICNLNGELIYKSIIKEHQSIISVDNISPGTYILKLYDENSARSFKIVKL